MTRHLNHALLFLRSLPLMASVALAGCGGSGAQKVQAPTDVTGGANAQQNSSSSGAGSCTKDNCPPASMDVASEGFSDSGKLIGYIDEPVPWDFKGIDLNSTDRKVGVLLDNIPSGSKINPTPDGKQVLTDIRLDWTPTKKMKSSVNLTIVLRDLSRCELSEADPKSCHVNKLISAYDKKVTVKWQIMDRSDPEEESSDSDDSTTVDVSSPDCGPTATTNSDITSKIIQTLSGGLLKTLGGILGGLGNSGGAGSAPTTTEC